MVPVGGIKLIPYIYKTNSSPLSIKKFRSILLASCLHPVYLVHQNEILARAQE